MRPFSCSAFMVGRLMMNFFRRFFTPFLSMLSELLCFSLELLNMSAGRTGTQNYHMSSQIQHRTSQGSGSVALDTLDQRETLQQQVIDLILGSSLMERRLTWFRCFMLGEAEPNPGRELCLGR